MGRIRYGDPIYCKNYPVLWIAEPSGLKIRETADLQGQLIHVVPYKTLVHYIGGYTTAQGYRWFRVRWEQYGDWWVGWAPAVNMNTGFQNIAVFGHLMSDGRRQLIAEYNSPVYSCSGTFSGHSSDYWYDHPSKPANLIHQVTANFKVPYPDQEDLYKPYFFTGKTYWNWVGGNDVDKPFAGDKLGSCWFIPDVYLSDPRW